MNYERLIDNLVAEVDVVRRIELTLAIRINEGKKLSALKCIESDGPEC